ncbi:MAG: HRDC domain-containing protein [Planctomycetota bacterium]
MNRPQEPAPSTPGPAGGRAWQAHRSRHRAQQDLDAHAEQGPFVPPTIAEHDLVPADQPDLITGQAALLDLIDAFRKAGSFGFDTEFIGENTYVPRLCLIQAATTDRIVLIDPFTVNDLTPWYALIADPTVEKIVHAGEQDLEPVVRVLDSAPANIFDTQVAAGFVGLDYPMSLGRLVAELIGDDLDAGAKFSRWDRRPLTERQLHYAASDVRYLAAMRAELRSRLESNGNTRWAKLACEAYGDPDRYTPDPLTRKVKAKGVNKLSRKKRAVLNGLLLWREGLAQQLDLPPRALVPDEAVYALADGLPESTRELAGVKFLPRPVREDHGPALLETIRAALTGPVPKRPVPPKYDRDEHRDAVSDLWQRIAAYCESMDINPSAITSKRELGTLVGAAMDHHQPPPLNVNTGWRRQLLGDLVGPDLLA